MNLHLQHLLGGDGQRCVFHELFPSLSFVLFWCFEVRIAVFSPGEAVAVHAQELALPLLLATAPGLRRDELSGVQLQRTNVIVSFASEEPTCVKWCSFVFLLPQLWQSGKSSLRFQRPAHSSTVMALKPWPIEGLISTGSPAMTLRHSTECTRALGLSLTSDTMSPRRFVLYSTVVLSGLPFSFPMSRNLTSPATPTETVP